MRSGEYPYKKTVDDPYRALATAVLKSAITVWKSGNLREKNKVEKWLKTEGPIKSYEFWCAAAGIDMDWLRGQLKKYERLKTLGKKKSELETESKTETKGKRTMNS